MRTIVNISLPKEMAAEIKREVKREGFASTSEFIRSLLREYRRAQLAEELKRQSKGFRRAKAAGTLKESGWKRIKSGKDLA